MERTRGRPGQLGLPLALMFAVMLLSATTEAAKTVELVWSGQNATFAWAPSKGHFTLTLGDSSTDSAWSYIQGNQAYQGRLNVQQAFRSLALQPGAPWQLTLLVPAYDLDPNPDQAAYAPPRLIEYQLLHSASYTWSKDGHIHLTFNVWPYQLGKRTVKAQLQVTNLWPDRYNNYNSQPQPTTNRTKGIITPAALKQTTSDITVGCPITLRLIAPRATLLAAPLNVTNNNATSGGSSSPITPVTIQAYNELPVGTLQHEASFVVGDSGYVNPSAALQYLEAQLIQQIGKAAGNAVATALEDAAAGDFPVIGQILFGVLDAFITPKPTLFDAVKQYVTAAINAAESQLNMNWALKGLEDLINGLINDGNQGGPIKALKEDLQADIYNYVTPSNISVNGGKAHQLMAAIDYAGDGQIMISGNINDFVSPKADNFTTPPATNALLRWEYVLPYQLTWCTNKLMVLHNYQTGFYNYFPKGYPADVSYFDTLAGTADGEKVGQVNECLQVITSNIKQAWADRITQWQKCKSNSCCDPPPNTGDSGRFVLYDPPTNMRYNQGCKNTQVENPSDGSQAMFNMDTQHAWGRVMLPFYVSLLSWANVAAHYSLLDPARDGSFVGKTSVTITHDVSGGTTGPYGSYNSGRTYFNEAGASNQDDLTWIEFGAPYDYGAGQWITGGEGGLSDNGRIAYIKTSRSGPAGQQAWGAPEVIASSDGLPFPLSVGIKSIRIDTTLYRINYVEAYGYNVDFGGDGGEAIFGLVFEGDSWDTTKTDALNLPRTQRWDIGRTNQVDPELGNHANVDDFRNANSAYLCGFEVHSDGASWQNGGGIYAIWFKWCFIRHTPVYPQGSPQGPTANNNIGQWFTQLPSAAGSTGYNDDFWTFWAAPDNLQGR